MPKGRATFGAEIAQLKREGKIPDRAWHGGRPPIKEKYRAQVSAVEAVFADAGPEVARDYVDELKPKDPEQCPKHKATLVCPDPHCQYESQRTLYNHQAAAYAIDRIMGKPTTRTENSLTVAFIQQIVAIFQNVNDLTDPTARLARFAEECRLLSGEGAST